MSHILIIVILIFLMISFLSGVTNLFEKLLIAMCLFYWTVQMQNSTCNFLRKNINIMIAHCA